MTSVQQELKLDPQLEAMLILWKNSYFTEKERLIDGVRDPLMLQNLQLEKQEFRIYFRAGLALHGEKKFKELLWTQYNEGMDAKRNK